MKNIIKLTAALLLALSLTGCSDNTDIGGTLSEKTLVSINITKAPDKTTYWMNESLDLTGLKVIATFSNHLTELIDNGELTESDFDSTTTGEKEITVSYGGKSDIFIVTVAAGNFWVTFHKNGGNSEASPQIKTVTQPSTNVDSLPTPPAKEYHAFAGWNTKADGSGSIFDETSLVTGSFPVYAQWTIETYSVTFNSNGGSAVTTQSIEHGEEAVEPAEPIIKNAYRCKFAGWYTDNITFNDRWIFSGNPVTEDVELYAKWLPYELGETGPGGGKIFYLSETGFPLIGTSETCYYLEVSPEPYLDRCEWSSTNAIPYTGVTIGYGRQNTQNIATKLNRLGLLDYYAAQVCDNYTNNGFDDWFLPSKDELYQLYINRNYVGNLTSIPTNIAYWSSTQNTSDTIDSAYIQYFTGDGGQPSAGLQDGFYVRAVRAF